MPSRECSIQLTGCELNRKRRRKIATAESSSQGPRYVDVDSGSGLKEACRMVAGEHWPYIGAVWGDSIDHACVPPV